MLNRVTKLILSSVVVLSVFFVMGAPESHAATAAQLVQMGRDKLAAHKLVEADLYFQQALTADPNDQNANFFRSLTRFLVIYEEPEFDSSTAMDSLKEFLDGLHASGTTPSVYDITGKVHNGYNIPKDANGHTQFYSGAPTGAKVQEYLFTKIKPKADASIANIDKLGGAFTVVLSPAENGTSEYVLVDKNDMLLLKSMLQLVKATIEFSYVYNVDIDPYDLYGKEAARYIANPAGGFYISYKNDVLGASKYASFLKPIAGRGTYLTSAKADLLASIDTYLAASAAIRARATSYMRRMITLDPDMAAKEVILTDRLKNSIKPSLSGTPSYFLDPKKGKDTHFDLSKAFNSAAPIDIRSKLPSYDPVTNKPDSPVPDPLFGGVYDAKGLTVSNKSWFGSTHIDEGFIVATGQAQDLVFQVRDVDSNTVSGATVTATFNGTGQVTLTEDHFNGAGAGFYHKKWTPAIAGNCKIVVTAHKSGYAFDAHNYVNGAVVTVITGTPAMDFCATPMNISALPFNAMVNIVNTVSTDPDDPSPPYDFNPDNTVWYVYTPATSGQIKISGASSDSWNYPPVTGVFGGSCGNMWALDWRVFINDPLFIDTTAGEPVYIMVGLAHTYDSSHTPYAVFTTLHVESVPASGPADWKPTTVFSPMVASVTNAGVETTGRSGWSLSRNGVIPFLSNSTDLVTNGYDNLFVRDTVAGKTERVTMGYDGTSEPDNDSTYNDISDDGNFVVYQSYATNIVAGDTLGYDDVFLYNRTTKATTRISMGYDGSEANGSSGVPYICGNGKYVLFESCATNLVSTDSNGVVWDAFLYDVQNNTTSIASLLPDGTQVTSSIWDYAISADGSYALFLTSEGHFKRDLVNGVTIEISAHEYWNDPARKNISDDGRFDSYYFSPFDIGVEDRFTGSRVSISSGGGEFWTGGMSADGVTLAATIHNPSDGTTKVYYGVNPLYLDLPRVTTSVTTTGGTEPAGGWVVVNPPAPGNIYKKGTAVTVTAVQREDYIFTGWSGGAAGTANPLSLTISANKAVTANFMYSPIANITLTPEALRPSPQLSGTQVKWTATATGGQGTFEYQFSRKGPGAGILDYKVVQPWGTSNTWTWKSLPADIGVSTVMVEVRNAIDDSGTKSKVSSAYTITSPASRFWGPAKKFIPRTR